MDLLSSRTVYRCSLWRHRAIKHGAGLEQTPDQQRLRQTIDHPLKAEIIQTTLLNTIGPDDLGA